MDLSNKLKESDFLKSKCDKFEIKEVSGTDLYYSDGAVQGATFKIEFSLTGTNYMRSVYFWPTGIWLCTSNNEEIKKLITEWVEKLNISDDKQGRTDQMILRAIQ